MFTIPEYIPDVNFLYLDHHFHKNPPNLEGIQGRLGKFGMHCTPALRREHTQPSFVVLRQTKNFDQPTDPTDPFFLFDWYFAN